MPPELENDIEEIEQVSTIEDQDGADASSEAEQSANAESSAAEDASKPADTLSVVRDVVGAKKEDAAASSATGEEGGKDPDADKQVEPDNEEYSDVPFNKHPRFQELLHDLKESRTAAERYRNVEQFIDQQGLNGDEAMESLIVGGLIKTNPVEAWKRMLPVVQKLAIAAGEMLPEDLKQRVANGDMNREAALELSRQRAAMTAGEARRDFETRQREARQQAEVATAVQAAASTWESERRGRDPNFEAKMPELLREVAWLQARDGKPKTPEGVRTQLQHAYDAVSKKFAPPATPQRKPAVTPVNGGQVNGSARPQPKSTLDIVRQEIERSRGAAA